jgi:hypothetical protein
MQKGSCKSAWKKFELPRGIDSKRVSGESDVFYLVHLELYKKDQWKNQLSSFIPNYSKIIRKGIPHRQTYLLLFQ